MATPVSKVPYGAIALLGLCAATLAAACKPTSESPEPEATATPYPTYVPAVTAPQSFVQITPIPKPPCDATRYECTPDTQVVDLCKQQQQDQTKCDPYMEKALYEELKAKITDPAATAECKSTSYVKTAEGGTVRVRSSMDTSNTSNVLGEVGHGSSLCVLGTEGSWYKIKFAAKIGYISGTYVSDTKPGPVVVKAPSTSGGTGGGTGGGSGSASGCTFTCPSGYFCSPTEKWLNVNNPSYHVNATEKSQLVSRVAAPLAICASGTRVSVSEGFPAGEYTMVKVRVSPTGKDYWMNCKYLADQAQSRIGCK